eukprot:10722289-Alexandrium_andersonii.AAC.1
MLRHTGPDLRIHATSSGSAGLKYHIDPNCFGLRNRKTTLCNYMGCGNCTNQLEYNGPAVKDFPDGTIRSD